MSLPPYLKKALTTVGIFVAYELGARIGLPGLNGEALAAFFHRLDHRGGVLGLYDWVQGGAMSRGAIIALGVMPYLSARIWVWLSTLVVPGRLSETAEGRKQLTARTRAITVLLGLTQAIGLTQFVEIIPGAVAHPGAAFRIPAIALLTAVTILTMLAAERVFQSDDEDEEVGVEGTAFVALDPSSGQPALVAPFPDATAGVDVSTRTADPVRTELR